MKEFSLIMPEIDLALTLAFIVAAEIAYTGEQLRLITAISLMGLGAAFIGAVMSYGYEASQVFSGVLSIDGFSLFFKLIFISLAGLNIAVISHTREIESGKRTEYCALIVASSLAMCLVASSSDLVFGYLSVLFLNIISYFLSAYGRRSILSTEAAVKSIAFGSVTGAFFLYSLALLFAHTHSLNIYEIHKLLIQNPLPSSVSLITFMLLFLGFSFQLGVFPMSLVFPDIMEGSPTPVSAFLSVGVRAAGFAMATRFIIVLFAQPGLSPGQWQVLGDLDWTHVVSIVSGLTMVFGSMLAFRQVAAKRLVGYLVVAESGFLLMGLLVLDEIGIAALLYNLVVQLFALMGIFYVLSFIVDEVKSDRFEDLTGMLRRSVFECICLVLFLFCLVGTPPLPGFIGKFTLIGAAIRHGRYPLALVSIFATVISTISVTRLAYHLVGEFRRVFSVLSPHVSRRIYLAALVIPMALIGIFADLVFGWAGQSLGFVFW